MAKLFKTISLEERWKASAYSTQPVKPMPVKQGQSPILNIIPTEVEQGSIQIKTKKPEESSPTAQLKQMVDPVRKNSELLRLMVKTATNASLPTPTPFNTTPLTQFALPFTNTKFRSAISLADRLSQPKLGSTTHLASYFLSDQFTDYITITPFGVFNHTSNITLLPFDFIPQQGGQNPIIPIGVINQGGLNPTIFNFNSILSQGALFSNGNYTSITTITQTQPAGTYIIDPQTVTATSPVAGALITNPQITVALTPIPGSLTTDPQTDTNPSSGPNANITFPNIVLGIVPTIQSLLLSQGVIEVSLGDFGSVITPVIPPIEILPQVPANIIITLPNTVTQIVPASIVLTTPIATQAQGGVSPTPIVFEPKRTSPVLNVLKFEAQRALAFFTPKVVHGSADLSASETVAGYFQNNITVDQGEAPIGGLATEPGFFQNNPEGLNTPTKSTEIIKELSNLSDDKSKLSALVSNAFNETNPSSDGRPKATAQGGKPNIDPYYTLTYDQIRVRAENGSKNTIGEDFRKALEGSLKGGNGQLVVIKDTTGKTVNERGVQAGDRKYENDFVALRVRSIRDNVTTYFRAFITSFSDNFSVLWNDINYVGRQDTLKAFKGATRGGNLGFKIAALREEDLKFNYFKLNELVKSAGVGKATSGVNYVQGPLCELTVGKWFTDTPVIFNSIKYDIQMAEYSWDIDKQVPHIIDVSLDFVLLGDVKGNPLNASSNNYLTYRG